MALKLRIEPNKEIGIVLLLLFGTILGYSVGGSIVGEHKAEGAVQWALSATAVCEKTFVDEGYSSVTECLEFAIWAAEDEIRARKSEEGR